MKSNLDVALAVLCFIVSLSSLIGIGILLESKGFNKGKCKKCNGALKYFDMDSQGGRGYTCENRANNCHYTVWVSYNCVDKNYC